MSTILLFISANILGFLFFLFFFWRRLKEDYPSELIFNSAFFTGIAIGLSVLVHYLSKNFVTDNSIFIYSQFWFWIGLLAYFATIFYIIQKQEFKFFETFEAGTVGLLGWMVFIYIAEAINNYNLQSLAFAVFIVILFILFAYFESNYRKYTWYKSGRVGFSGLLILGIYFLSRTALAIFSIPMISLVGRSDVILSGIMGFLMFFSVYHLSERH